MRYKTSAHGDESIAQLAKRLLSKQESLESSHKRSFTDETFIEHIAGNPLDAGYANEGFINVNIRNQ
jgi:hypothetical protein